MTRITWPLGLVCALIVACGGDERAAAPAPVTSMPGQDVVAAARAAKVTGAPVIDVRSQEEWDEGHAVDARHMPIDGFADRLAEVEALVGGDRGRPVVVVCRSGNRAAKAKQQLEARGFTAVINGGKWENLR